MGEHKYVVKVPKPVPGSYNPDRPITSLVYNQILHLSLAERHLPKTDRSGIDIYSLQTEGQASEYIHHLMRKLHPRGTKPAKSRAHAPTAVSKQKKTSAARKRT